MDRREGDVSIQYEETTDTYRVSGDWWRERSPSAAVALAVGAVTDTPPTELDPLFEAVDPDALDQLYETTRGGSGREFGRVSFRYNDCVVTVYATGTIEITPAADDSRVASDVPRAVIDR